MQKRKLESILAGELRRKVMTPLVLFVLVLSVGLGSYFSFRHESRMRDVLVAFNPALAAELASMNSPGLQRQMSAIKALLDLESVHVFSSGSIYLTSDFSFQQSLQLPKEEECDLVRNIESSWGSVAGKICLQVSPVRRFREAGLAFFSLVLVAFAVLSASSRRAMGVVSDTFREVREPLMRARLQFAAGEIAVSDGEYRSAEADELAHLIRANQESILSVSRAEAAIERAKFVEKLVLRVAHDIRSPLAVIRALSSRIDFDSDEAEHFREAIERVGQIAQDVLRGNPASIQPEAEQSRFDPVLILNKTLAEKRIEHPLVRFELVDGQKLDLRLGFRGGPTAFYRVLSNLLNNAAEASQNGWVRLVCARRGPFFALSLTNSGSLFPEEVLKSFDQGTRLKSTKVDGHGIGLVSTRELVDASGGRIEISNSDGCANVSLILPCV